MSSLLTAATPPALPAQLVKAKQRNKGVRPEAQLSTVETFLLPFRRGKVEIRERDAERYTGSHLGNAVLTGGCCDSSKRDKFSKTKRLKTIN